MTLQNEVEKEQDKKEQETITAEESPDMENDNDEIDNSEDLEEQKRKIKEFHAEGNYAQKQIFIQEVVANGLMLNPYNMKTEVIAPKLPVDKKYDLSKQEECIEFVEAFNGSEYFTIAVLLCVFETVLLEHLEDLKLNLLNYLPKEVVYDSEGKEVHISRKNPYISLDSILAVVGGRKVVMDDGRQAVSLGECSVQALQNMLEQFPALQEAVIELIIWFIQDSRYQTTFYNWQMASFCAKMVSLKLLNVENKVFSQLYTSSANTYLLGCLIYKLYERENAKDADLLISQWIYSDSSWLWKAVCVAYILLEKNDKLVPFEKEWKKMLYRKIPHLKRGDMSFIAELLIQSKNVRTIVCETLCNVYKHAVTDSNQRAVARLYINLVRQGYYKINSAFIELPLVACDTKEQQEYLTNILNKVMMEYRLRRQIYAILKAYLRELSGYEFSERVINHIAAFCYNMSSTGEEYREDIMEFLQEWNNQVAKKVISLL